MKSENTVQRIKEYIDYKGISVRKFEESVGFSNGSFGSQYKNNKTIGVDKVEYILRIYNDINPVWLLTGEGSMLRSEQGNNNAQSISGDNNIQAGSNSKVKAQLSRNDSLEVLRSQIDERDRLLEEKELRIKEKDTQLREKDIQINKLLSILSK